MAEYIKHSKMPKNYRVILTSDWHCGAAAFHEEAARDIVERLKSERNTFMLFNGDFVEGKRIDSPHFNPDSLNPKYLTIGKQFDYVADMLKPVAKKILAVGQGNHDIYLSRDYDVVERLCKDLGIPERRGGYQTWVKLGDGLRVFMYHGRASCPRGAKDPIQRDANRKAWLKNRLESLASDCHVMLMGHVHQLFYQEPLEQVALLSGGKNVRRHTFVEPESKVVGADGHEATYVPKESRWYGCTGTLRRGGGFGYTDYSEIAGFGPSPIGYLEMTVEKGRCVNIEEVIV